MKKSVSRSLLSITLAGACLALSGCNVCQDVDAKVCADLGPQDCALWKEKGFDFVTRAEEEGPRRRQFLRDLVFGKGSSTCQSATHDAVYPQMLAGFKAQVAAARASDEAVQAAEQKSQAE